MEFHIYSSLRNFSDFLVLSMGRGYCCLLRWERMENKQIWSALKTSGIDMACKTSKRNCQVCDQCRRMDLRGRGKYGCCLHVQYQIRPHSSRPHYFSDLIYSFHSIVVGHTFQNVRHTPFCDVFFFLSLGSHTSFSVWPFMPS